VNLLEKNNPQALTWQRRIMRMLPFPCSVLAIYGILYAVNPVKVSIALTNTGSIFSHMIVPISLVIVLMLVLNLFLKPAQIVKFLGEGAGIKGVILSTVAGIISTGPVYAWYPLLKDLREKGARDSFTAIFLGNRAIKLPLLPIMISYFGWVYVVILTIFTILASICAGYAVGALVKKGSSGDGCKA